MNKIIIPIFVSLSFLFLLTEGGKIGKGKIDEKGLVFLKQSYNWNEEDFLIISFRQPKHRCHYDNYQNLSKTERAIIRFGESIEEKNVRNVFVSSDKQRVKSYVDFNTTYADSEDFILNTFFENEKSCYGLVVINKKGSYMSQAGEFVTKDIDSFVFLLKSLE